MAKQLRVTLEIGPHGKQVAAVAPDWPGLERGAKTEEAALTQLHSYLPRYAPVAKLAGMEAEFAAISTLEVVEQYAGTGSTDFWGISFAFSSLDRQALSREVLERELTLLQACWAFFDDVRGRVSAQMRDVSARGEDVIGIPSSGIRCAWSKTGQRRSGYPLKKRRCRATKLCKRTVTPIATLFGRSMPRANWPLRYLIRHSAYHTLDHAWEMQDKDLTVAAS